MKLHDFFTMPRVLAHRGASAYAPENTLAAIHKGIAQGCNWIEVDIGFAECGELIVLHDENLFRTTGLQRKAHEVAYRKIKELDAGGWFHDDFAGEKIPTLTDLLHIIKKHNVGFNLEIKPYADIDSELAENIFITLDDLVSDYKSHILVSSYSLSSLKMMRSLDPDIPLAWLPKRLPKDWLEIIENLHCSAVNLGGEMVSAQRIKLLKQYVPYVLVYTIDDPERAKALYDMGVDGIFTNAPDKILPIAQQYFPAINKT